ETAIDCDQIAAFTVRAVLVGRADKIHRERSHGWQSGRSVQQQFTGWRHGTALRGRLIDDVGLLTGGGKEPETAEQNGRGATKKADQQPERRGTQPYTIHCISP